MHTKRFTQKDPPHPLVSLLSLALTSVCLHVQNDTAWLTISAKSEAETRSGAGEMAVFHRVSQMSLKNVVCAE